VITVTDRREDATTSFTDETSPKLSKSDRKVSIHGQVIREGQSLRWFRDLVKLYPNDNPETKSVRILEDFGTYPQEFRDRTWIGMKKVRIHIVDSLSYQTNYEKILANVFKGDELRKMVERDARRGDDFAKYIRTKMDETVTEWIIKDSTSHRLRDMMENDYPPYSLSFYLRPLHPTRRDHPVNLRPFRTKVSSMTSKAVKVASKAASVFTPAMDRLGPIRHLGESYGQYEVHRTLRDSHAFDQGDDKALKWIDDERKDIGGRGWMPYDEGSTDWMPDGVPEYVDDFGESETYSDFAYGRLYSVKSHESEYVQAADIAAGFARDAYERYSVVAVAEQFEYVTINGERVTQDNAQERFEYWRQLHEREQQNAQPLILVN
jgi:hypothetical protein